MKKLLLITILCSLFSGSALSNTPPKGVWWHSVVVVEQAPDEEAFSVGFNKNSFSIRCSQRPAPHKIFINGYPYDKSIDLIIDGVTVKFSNNYKGNPSAIISKIQKAKTLQVVYGDTTINVPMGNKKALEAMSTTCSYYKFLIYK